MRQSLNIEPFEERNLWAIAYRELRKAKIVSERKILHHRGKNLKITRSGAVFSPQSRSLTKDFREYTKDDFSELQLIYFSAFCDKMK